MNSTFYTIVKEIEQHNSSILLLKYVISNYCHNNIAVNFCKTVFLMARSYILVQRKITYCKCIHNIFFSFRLKIYVIC